jgi:periplasmic divalent cation tolerance protein
MSGRIVVTTTCSSEEEALRVARAVVERRLAACAQVQGGVRSVYRWKGAVEEAGEWLVTFKTRTELFDRLGEAVRGLHSYETPELIATPVVDGSAEYLAWLDGQVEA